MPRSRTPRTAFKVRKLAFMVGSLLAASQAYSQAIVTGRVADATGAALPGAQVQIQGQNVRGTTNNQGEFTLMQVPAGNQTIIIDYLGYRTVTQTLTLTDGQRSTNTFTLLPATSSSIIDEVIVVARPIADGQARALNQQRMNDNVSNIVSADAIGRFPDPNIAEALQRTPGIGIERDQGEGRYINVRGAPAEFSAVQIDGVSLPAPDPGTRAVDLDTIPSDIVSQIEVSKTLQPYHDADSIAGAVNIVTRSPFDSNGMRIRGSGGMSHNEYGGDNDSRANMLISNVFGDNQEFGALVSLSYSKTRRAVDNVEHVWVPVDTPEGGEVMSIEETLFKDYDTRRERMAATGMLEWRPTDTDSYFIRGSWARFEDDEFRNRLDIIWADGSIQPGATDRTATYANTRIQKQHRHRVQRNNISSIALGGSHELESMLVDYTLSFSRAEQSYPNRDELLWRSSLRPTLSYDFRGNSNEPQLSLFNTNEHLQLDRYAFRENTFRSNDAVEDEMSFAANSELPGYLFDKATTYKFGVKYRGREKDHDEERWRDRRGASAPAQPITHFLANEISDNYDYFLGSKMDPVLVREYLASTKQNSLTQRRIPQSFTADYNVEENILAAYGQAKIELNEKTDVIMGLRIERTEFDGQAPRFNEDTGALTQNRSDNNYTELFPSITLKYSFSDQLIGRAAITRAINRPNFPDIVPRIVENDETASVRRVTLGNPGLNPTLSNNFDLMLEYYMLPLGILSGGVFYKDLEDYRFDLTRNGIYQGSQVLITSPENAPSGRIVGAEVNWQQQLDMLPGWLSGFGYMVNYTYTDAHMKLSQPYAGRDRFALTGQSRTNWNTSVFYENYGLSVRLAYTDRSDYLDGLNADDARMDFFWEGRGQLDLTASYAANENLEIYFEGKNLSDTRGLRYYGARQFAGEYEKFGALYFLGVRFNY
jgi:TonB-dependent receptor